MARRLGLMLATLLCLAGATACSSGSGTGSSASTAPSTTGSAAAPPTTTVRPPVTAQNDVPQAIFSHGWPVGSGGTCDGHTPGADHVTMTFCHGPASVTITLPDGPHTLHGVCWFNGGTLELDAGTTVGTGWSGPWPDYATIQLPNQAGGVSNDFVAFVGGSQHLVQTGLGSLTAPGLGGAAPITAANLGRAAVTVHVSGDSTEDKVTISLDATC